MLEPSQALPNSVHVQGRNRLQLDLEHQDTNALLLILYQLVGLDITHV